MTTSPLNPGRRALFGAARAVLKSISARPQETKLQQLDLEALAGEPIDGAEHMEPYGFTARPHAGAEAVVVFVGGNRSHPLVVAVADRRYRLQGLVDGELALYDDLGQKVHLTRSGIVVTAPTITLAGHVVVTDGLTVTGGITDGGVEVGATHTHGGVTPGTGNTGTPN